MKKKIAVITGANRGMGLATTIELAKNNFHVIMVGKNLSSLENETELLKRQNLNVEYFLADVSITDDCHNLIHYVQTTYDQIDILINNAGIYVEEVNCTKTESHIFESTLNVNTKAPYILIKGFLPLMIKQNYGRIVNVSSQLGSIDGVSAHCLSYSVSKAALNILTKIFAEEVKTKNIKINSICPGWVKTDIGGKNAPRSIKEGIDGIIWAATLSEHGPSGGFYHDKKLIPW